MAQQSLFRTVIFSLLFIVSAVNAQVIEIPPDELDYFLSQHNHAILQFTSPDKNCGHCIGADKSFNAMSSKSESDVIFARIQWEPWHKVPKTLDKRFRIVGVPMQVCYRDGEVVRRLIGAMRKMKDRVIKDFENDCASLGE